jgi:hypothetical protein
MSIRPHYFLNVGDLVVFGDGWTLRTCTEFHKGKIIEVRPGQTLAQVHYRVRITHTRKDIYAKSWEFDQHLQYAITFPGMIKFYAKRDRATPLLRFVVTLP